MECQGGKNDEEDEGEKVEYGYGISDDGARGGGRASPGVTFFFFFSLTFQGRRTVTMAKWKRRSPLSPSLKTRKGAAPFGLEFYARECQVPHHGWGNGTLESFKVMHFCSRAKKTSNGFLIFFLTKVFDNL